MSFGNLTKTVTTAGTAERLSSTDLYVYSFHVRAKSDNTGSIYFGGALVDDTTTPVAAGEDFIWSGQGNGAVVPIKNLRDVWIDADNNGDGVTVVYDPA